MATTETAGQQTTGRHDWRFFRAGGFDQVLLDRGSDLLQLAELDQKLWAALSCPVKGLEMDERTLALIDSDQDGHIRAPELMAAIHWAAERLRHSDLLLQALDPLPLSAIDCSTPAGQALYSSARQISGSPGKADSDSISVADASNRAAILAALPLNGDGIITPNSSDDPAIQEVITLLCQALGGITDSSNRTGIDAALIDTAFAALEARQTWEAAAVLPEGLADADAAAAAWSALAAVRAKVDDYFTRCALAAFDARAGHLLNSSDATLEALSPQALHPASEAIAALPLAQVAPDAPLPLCSGLNPAWQAAIATLVQTAIRPLSGEVKQLAAADWQQLCAWLAPYGAWQANRPATPLDGLDAAARQALAAPGLRQTLLDLVAADAAVHDEAEAIVEVERLTRYVRDLARLTHNFVSFSDFYRDGKTALFQAGKLYLDGRCCKLCLKVLDPARHATLASLSGIYLVYCDCVRGTEKISIAAALTAGDADQLMVGRNGVFYDQAGNDWDATIVRIVDHPISLRQAFWSPYKKMGKLVGEQVQKFANARAKSVEDSHAALIAEGGKKPDAGKPATPTASPFDAARFAGIFAAIGLALGAIGTALASIMASFFKLQWWQMPLAVLGIMLLISGPSVVLAFLKLRQRNLGPLLDAGGWAINTRARINLPFGVTLTELAELPEGAARNLHDPYPGGISRYAGLLIGLGIGALIAAILLVNLYWPG